MRASAWPTTASRASDARATCRAIISLASSGGSRRQQLLQPDRQLADADAGRVVDRIRDRRRGADIGELADALHTDRIDLVVLLGNQDHIDLSNVSVHRD